MSDLECLEQLVQHKLLDIAAMRLDREAKRLKHAEQLCLNAVLMNRPCLVMQPMILRDGDQWEARKGDLVGRGDTPAAAMDDFDDVFTNG
jgi:hypothetical protein